ncbi:unnamed protein product [Prorocentrum cordatum]|uniref:RNA-directed RNA polymerase n=1 Tax=Prorocentrum cordatum TaxID=2364126 RepID=A0ABN9ULR8_9DINO|nr:unnamed protein product [Polarella glacialis]
MDGVAIPGGAAALPAWVVLALEAPPPCAACPACEARACPTVTAGEKAVEKLAGALLGGVVHWLVGKVIARRHVDARGWWTRALPGERVVCRSADDEVDHERVLLHYVAEGEWVILTPDGDIYAEDMSCENPETGPSRAFPLALRTRKMRRLYRFREALGPDELADALTRGRQAALEIDAALPEPREAVAVSGQRVSWQEASGRLSAAERAGLLRLGMAVARLGGKLLEVPVAGQAWIALSGGPGIAVGAEVDVADGEGLSFEGGPEPFGVLRASDGSMVRLARLDAVAAPGRVTEEAAGGVYDQLNMGGLMMVEVLTRRVAAVVDAYSDPTKPSWTNARFFEGVSSVEDVSGPELRGYRQSTEQKELEVTQQARGAVAAEAAAGAAGPGAFLPLPLLGDAGRRIRGRSCRARQFGREGRIASEVNGIVDAINWMSGYDSHPGPANDMQRDVLERFEGLVRGRQPDAKLQEPQAALRELLRGRSPYDGRGGPTTVASYSAGLVSMPTDVSDCPRLEDLLPGEALTFLQERQERMLRETPLSTDVEPYFDSVLKFYNKEYRGLVRRLLSAGILGWTLTPKERIGMFFVWKDGRRRLRLIVDARRANAHFRDPPGVELLSSEGLARIEVQMPDAGLSSYEDLRAALQAQQVYIGMADVKDCFHRMRIDSALSQYFCLPPVKAGAFGVTEVEGAKLVSGVMNQLTGEFTELNLLLHKDELVPGMAVALGTEIDGSQLRTRVTSDRFWRCRQAVRGLLARRRVKGWAVEAVLGHLTFCGLCSRGTLSAFNSVHGFVRAHYDEAAVLWAEARRELAAFSSLMYFLESDWWLPWNPMVQQSDASLHGYGLARAFWPQKLVESVGRVPERARFRRRCAHSAREAALCAAGFSMSESGKWELKGLPEDEEELGQWDVARDFPEVPAQGLRAGLWEPCFARAWQHPEGILTLEARALSTLLAELLELEGSQASPGRVSAWAEPERAADGVAARDAASAPSSARRAGALSEPPAGQARRAAWGGPPADEAAGAPPARGRGVRRTRQLVPAPPIAPLPLPAARRERQLGESGLLKTAVLSRPLPRSLGQVVEDLTKVPVPAEPARGARESVDSSDSGSSEPEVVTGAARLRRLAQSQKRRARHYGMPAGEEGFSLLEREAVRTPTQREYQRAWDGWRDFARRSWPSVDIDEVMKSRDDSVVDSALVSYLNGLYQAGTHLSWAEKLMAGVLHFNPDFSRYGARRLPRGWRCLRAWRRLEPPRTRKPWALALWCAMAWRMKARGSLQMAVFTLIAVSVYARPSSLLLLKPACLVPPAPGVCEFWTLRLFPEEEDLRDKTGLGDVSLELDSPWIRFLDPVLRQMKKEGHPECLWNFTSAQQNVFLVCEAQLADIILGRASPVDLRELDHA